MQEEVNGMVLLFIIRLEKRVEELENENRKLKIFLMKTVKDYKMDTCKYPTDAELKSIGIWPFDFGFIDLMNSIIDLWNHDYGKVINRGRTYTFITGGWSGNEDIIGAMQENFIFWSLCWLSSKRGGHFKFYIPKLKRNNK